MCKHRSAVVVKSIKRLGVTQMLCTCGCRQPFWMLETKAGISVQVPVATIAEVIGKQYRKKVVK